MEEELAAEWQAKCDKLLATAVDKHTRQMNSVKDELEEAQDQVAKLEAKVSEAFCLLIPPLIKLGAGGY